VNDLQEQNTLSPPYEWEQPRAHSLWISDVLLSGWKGKFFRTLLIVVVIELFFYLLLQRLPLKEIEFNLDKALLIVFLAAIGMSSYTYLIGPYLIRFSRTKYKVSDKGIRTNSSSNNHLYTWKNIVQCCPVENHELLEGIICIYFYTKQSPDRPRALVFDKTQNDFAEKVYSYIQDKLSSRIQTLSKNLPRIKLDFYQHIYMIGLSLVGTLLFIYLMPRLKNLDNDFMPLVFLFVLIFGPGTWGMFLLYGKNLFKYKDCFMWMIAYNFITLILAMIIKLILVIIEASKIFQQNP